MVLNTRNLQQPRLNQRRRSPGQPELHNNPYQNKTRHKAQTRKILKNFLSTSLLTKKRTIQDLSPPRGGGAFTPPLPAAFSSSCTPPLLTASPPLHSDSKVHWSIDKTLSQRREGGQTYIPTVLPTFTEVILLHYLCLCLWVAFPVSCLSAGPNGMEAKSPGFKIALGSQPSLHEFLLRDTSFL